MSTKGTENINLLSMKPVGNDRGFFFLCVYVKISNLLWLKNKYIWVVAMDTYVWRFSQETWFLLEMSEPHMSTRINLLSPRDALRHKYKHTQGKEK